MRTTDFKDGYPGRQVAIPEAPGAVAFVPNNLPPQIDLDAGIQQLNESALLALGGLDALIPSLPNPELVTNPFLRKEAVLSSKIEGTHTTLEQLYLFEANDPATRPENAADAREVYDYLVASKFAFAQLDEFPICNRLLKQVHERLMANSPSRWPGEFRPEQAYIGSRDLLSARYVAPPCDRLIALMDSLERYINSPRTDLPRLVQIAIVHYQFESIHPFGDGNGRIGRLLISLLLRAFDILREPLLYLSAYFERNRNEYVDHLWEISRCGAWEPWIRFFLQGVITEANDACMRTRELIKLREECRAKFQATRGQLLKLVESLFDFPVVTVPGAQKLLQLSTYRGTRQLIGKLEEAGFLQQVGNRKRNKLFVARRILDLLG
ncbi:MAG: Fic/DOC family N-terminal domain-containing protein [Pirellulales bacterium]